MRYGWLPLFVLSVASSIGLFAGLSAAENTFRLEETTIAEIHEAVVAGALSSEKLVELYLARIAAYDRAGPRLNSIIYINPNAKAEAAALDKERADQGMRRCQNSFGTLQRGARVRVCLQLLLLGTTGQQ